MSKKKTKIEIDKFYNFYGGKSHPSLVYEKTNRKTYKALKFGTTRGKHMTEIKPIQKGYEKSYVQNRPVEGTRDDYGNKLEGLSVDPLNQGFLNEIKKRPTHKTKRAKRRYENQKKPPNHKSS
jgi:hypothetical protein